MTEASANRDSANPDSAMDMYGDGEVPEDADLNAPGAKNETAADDAVKNIAESLPGSGKPDNDKTDNDGQLPPGAPLP